MMIKTIVYFLYRYGAYKVTALQILKDDEIIEDLALDILKCDKVIDIINKNTEFAGYYKQDLKKEKDSLKWFVDNLPI